MNFLTVLAQELFIDIAGRIYSHETKPKQAQSNTFDKVMGITALAMGLWFAFSINEFFISKETILKAIQSHPSPITQGIAQGFKETLN